jgi:CDP-2,3-bis-(O-geranylgeranyl)-sn-glycerol synthase
MHEVLVFQLLMLLAVANGTPVAAKRMLGDALAYPLDGGALLPDGQPLFGHSKTVRGVLLAVLATTLASLLLGLGWKVGALVGATAMAGDLFSSFIKRRLGLPPSSMALGLDQIPESLFPLFACRMLLPLNFLDIAIATLLFLVGSLVLSRILFRFNLRDRPY